MNGTLAPLTNGERHRRVEAAEQGGNPLTLHQLARGNYALGGIAFVVADEQRDLLAKEAALLVDLIDGERQAADDGLAGLG
jgi:hypothetical protein